MSTNMSAAASAQRATRLLLTSGALSTLMFFVPATLVLMHSVNLGRDGDPEAAGMAGVILLAYPGVLSVLKVVELVVGDAPALFRDAIVLIAGSMLYFAVGTLWAWCAVSIRSKGRARPHLATTAFQGITLLILSLLLLQALLATALVFFLGVALTLNTHNVVVGSVLGISILTLGMAFMRLGKCWIEGSR
ncbi:MAG: hypothetical protein ACJ71N_09155 [Terriglobales bacterium]|jgi:hypothetical protein